MHDDLFWLPWRRDRHSYVYTARPDKIKALTLKNLTVSRRCTISNKLISINLLEFLVEIINYAAVTSLFNINPASCKNSYPILLNWTDNLTSKSWIKKAATKTAKGK